MNDDLVAIEKFELVKEDERGVMSEFMLPRKQRDFIFVFRKANTISGNAYHEGKSEPLKPKVLILLSGIIQFSYRKVNDDEVIHLHVDFPALIKIQPLVVHKVETITDAIFLEANSIADIEDDRYKELV